VVAIEVVDFAMTLWSTIRSMEALGVERLVRPREVRGLVHVVPDPSHPLVDQCLLLLPPPRPGLCVEEVREPRLSRPDLAEVVGLPIRSLHESVHFPATLKDTKLRVILHPRVDDRDHLESLAAELAYQCSGAGERLAEREDPVAIHVVDVEVQDVARELAFPEFLGDLFHDSCVS